MVTLESSIGSANSAPVVIPGGTGCTGSQPDVCRESATGPACDAGRVDKYRTVTFVQKRLFNPLVRAVLGAGVPIPGYALLETRGRTSGLPRTTPVGDGLRGSTFWI